MARKPLLLMTDAGHYEVSYVINPWMTPDAWSKDSASWWRAALAASDDLKAALEAAGAEVQRIGGAPGLPDMVFPANAAIVLDRRALAREVLDELGRFPKGVFQEGAGDCIWDATRQHFWAGYDQRSVRAAVPAIEDFFDARAVPLELVSPRFYHLDVCFLPLCGGEVVYYPKAFSPDAQAAIRERVAKDKLIEAGDEDAAGFCVNAVNIGREIVMATPTERLRDILCERGYRLHGVDLAPFIMSGGGAYCMTLRLDRMRAHAQAAKETVTAAS
jgi:N-dimethylarginine dimethylaminohydrolase